MLYTITRPDGQLVTMDSNLYEAMDFCMNQEDEPKLFVTECREPEKSEGYYRSGEAGAVLTYTRGKLTGADRLNRASDDLLKQFIVEIKEANEEDNQPATETLIY